MAKDNSINLLKRQIKYLFEKHPNIHISIKIPHQRISVEKIPATITGVYPNLFVVTECSKGHEESHTVMYTEVWTKQIEIHELKNFK